MQINNLLIFDIKGKFGHFKKFYSNSSSLTYYFPPKTTILGMIASILELPRDSYSELFKKENCLISLSIKTPLKKNIQCMNYENWKDNKSTYTQVRLEVLSAINKKQLRYRIYLWHKDLEMLKNLKNKLISSDNGYGVYLGQRQFIAKTCFIDLISSDNIVLNENSNKINSVTPLKNIVGLPIMSEEKEYVRSRMPVLLNNDRELLLSQEFLSEIKSSIIEGEIRDTYTIKYLENRKVIKEDIVLY